MTGVPTVGERAPDFELPEAYGGAVRLSEVLPRATAVVAFYPSDWGAMCAVEMRMLKYIHPQLRALGAEVLAISTNSTFCQSAWRMHMDLPFPLLSDFHGRVSSTYGVLVGDESYMHGRSKRSVFVVDRSGILRYQWITEDPAIEPDYDVLLEVCQELLSEEAASSPAPAGRTPGSSIF